MCNNELYLDGYDHYEKAYEIVYTIFLEYIHIIFWEWNFQYPNFFFFLF